MIWYKLKPTGQVNRLVLSLEYDIVKAHEGELKSYRNEGKGCEFVIVFPVK